MFTIDRIGALPIFHAHTKDRSLLALAFLRMQEHYESPVFRGKVFPLDEFIAWYSASHEGFTYIEDWSGFNVPSSAAQTVFLDFADHSPEEMMLYDALQKVKVLEHERFYLIGSTGSNKETLHHEVCHALYYLVPTYRAVAERVSRQFELAPFRRYLQDIGYGPEVIDDELHAYAMSYLPKDAPCTREFRVYRRELKVALKPFLTHYLAAP